jgi:hypothetical protein
MRDFCRQPKRNRHGSIVEVYKAPGARRRNSSKLPSCKPQRRELSVQAPWQQLSLVEFHIGGRRHQTLVYQYSNWRRGKSGYQTHEKEVKALTRGAPFFIYFPFYKVHILEKRSFIHSCSITISPSRRRSLVRSTAG